MHCVMYTTDDDYVMIMWLSCDECHSDDVGMCYIELFLVVEKSLDSINLPDNGKREVVKPGK